MTGRLVTLLAMLLVLTGPANSQKLVEHPAQCRVAEQLVESVFPLPHVAVGIAAQKLNVLVLGAGSPLLRGATGVH